MPFKVKHFHKMDEQSFNYHFYIIKISGISKVNIIVAAVNKDPKNAWYWRHYGKFGPLISSDSVYNKSARDPNKKRT